jgi:tetratricopeptide (TPR) repeat protein
MAIDQKPLWRFQGKKFKSENALTSQQIIEKILSGEILEDDLVCDTKTSNWKRVSTINEFYDAFLSLIETQKNQSHQSAKEEKKLDIVFSETHSHIKSDAQKKEPSITRKTIIEPYTGILEVKKSSTKIDLHSESTVAPSQVKLSSSSERKNTKNKKSEDVIDLLNINKVDPLVLIEKLKIPILIFVFLATGLLLFYFIHPGAKIDLDRIHLLAVTKKTEPLSADQIKQKMAFAIKALEKDTFDGYLEAQNHLVAMVESSPRELEPRSLLCFVYRELWPYSFQDAQDQKTIDQLVQSTKTINLMDPHGVLCEVVKLHVAGRVKEARGAVDNLLDLGDRFSLYPILFFMKADYLSQDKDVLNSAPYFEKAIQLWPTWIKPKMNLAYSYLKNKDWLKALEQFRAILQLQPKNKMALIGTALVEIKAYNQAEQAYNHLLMALDIETRIPRSLESEALENLAELSIMKGQKSDAQKYACRSYEINPQRKEAQDICLRFGGNLDQAQKHRADDEMTFIGDQYVRAGDCLSAQAEFKTAFEMNPKNANAAVKAAKCLWILNQSSEAIDWLVKAAKADPNLISAYVLQADYLSQRYDFVGAEQILMTASRKAPNNYEIIRGLALVAFRRNDFQTAMSLAQRASKIYDADVETYTLLSNASREFALLFKPTNDKERQKKDQIIKDFVRYSTKAVELDATNAEAQIAFAKMLVSTTGVDSGINYVKDLIKKYSYSTDYRIALASILAQEERHNQAIEVLEQVITFESKNKKALLGLGKSYRASGMVDKALATYLKAAVVDPSDPEPLFEAGQLYLESGRFEEAYQQFQRVLKVNNKYPRGYYYLGKTSFASGNLNEALEQLNTEKKIYPNLPDSYLMMAEVFFAQQRYSDCAGEYSKATKLAILGADVYVKSARCYRLSGSLDIAEDMLALAKDRESGYAEIFREQGAIFQSRGSPREAVKAYETYLELSPNAPDKSQVEALIAQLGT